MPDKFQNKYVIASNRLKGIDYSQNGMYFVTICTKDRENFLGEIMDKEMKLSAMGEMVKNEWLKTPKIRKNIILDEWIIMPNHLHGIICINNTSVSFVETHCNASLQTPYKNKFGPQSNNLSAIIRGFKGTTTKQIHLAGYKYFLWQQNYHDHIIRTEKELNRIREYIFYNPVNWATDRNNLNIVSPLP